MTEDDALRPDPAPPGRLGVLFSRYLAYLAENPEVYLQDSLYVRASAPHGHACWDAISVDWSLRFTGRLQTPADHERLVEVCCQAARLLGVEVSAPSRPDSSTHALNFYLNKEAWRFHMKTALLEPFFRLCLALVEDSSQ